MSGGNVLPQLPLFDPPHQKAFRDLRIAYRFGEAAIAPVRALYQREVTPAPTIDERLERIEREVAEIRKVAA